MRRDFLKRLVFCLLTFGLSFPAYADPDASNTNVRPGSTGNYVGFQIGSSNISSPTAVLPNNEGEYIATHPQNHSFAFRVLWGYQFTNLFAIEGGYANLGSSAYKIQNGNQPELSLQDIDLVGKAVFPFFWGLNAFAKGGVAVVFYKQAGLLAPNPDPGASSGSTGYSGRPELGIGVGYSLTANWMLDLSYTQIFKGGVIPKTTYYTIGISYHAVDLYCGQFLC